MKVYGRTFQKSKIIENDFFAIGEFWSPIVSTFGPVITTGFEPH